MNKFGNHVLNDLRNGPDCGNKAIIFLLIDLRAGSHQILGKVEKNKIAFQHFYFYFFLRSDLAKIVDYKIRMLVFNLSD